MKTHKFLLALMGTLIVGTGSAQTWTVNGASQSSSLTSSSTESAVAIDPVSGIVALRTAGVVPVPGVTVTAPGTAGFGQNISVSWSTTGFTGSVTCTASASTSVAGWSGTLSSSPVQVTTPSSAQTLTLSLQCTGSNGTASNSANVVISDSSCPPPGYKRDEGAPFVPYNLQVTQYSQLFGAGFPGFDAFANSSLGPGQVLAAEFIAPQSTTSDGYFEVTSLASGPGTPITSLSLCPGEIDYRLNGVPATRGCMRVGNEGGPTWTINNNQQLSVIRCRMTPGTRYYLNIAFESCDGGACNYRATNRSSTARGDQEAVEAQQEQGQGQ